MAKVHTGGSAGQAAKATPWSTAITATTERHVYVRGVALDESIGRESYPAMILRMWRGDVPTEAEAALLGACFVAAVDHGPLAPSALTARTIASTRATPMSALAGAILSFGDLHGAVVSQAMRVLASAPPTGDLAAWADAVFLAERAAGRRLPGIGHRWHAEDLRAERLLEIAASVSDARHVDAARALADRVGDYAGHRVAVNIDGGLAVALSVLRLDPEYGDFVFAIARSVGMAAHIVEERARERPMRLIDPTSAMYDGEPIPEDELEDTTR